MLEVKMMKSLESTLTKERDKQVSTLTLSKYSLKQKSKKIDTMTAECEILKTQLGDSVQQMIDIESTFKTMWDKKLDYEMFIHCNMPD